MRTLPHPWGGCFSERLPSCTINILCWDETSSGSTCTSCPLSSLCAFLWRESLYPLCSCPLSTEILWWGSPEPSLLLGEKTWLPCCFLLEKVLQPFNYLCGPPLDLLLSVHVFLELWGPELGTELQVQPDKHWVKWSDNVSISANSAPAGAVQDPTHLCCCSGARLTHVQLVVHLGLQVPSSKIAPQPHRS